MHGNIILRSLDVDRHLDRVQKSLSPLVVGFSLLVIYHWALDLKGSRCSKLCHFEVFVLPLPWT